MKKIRTEMFIETHEVSLVKRKRFFVRAFCEHCQREVSLLPPAEAAFLICQETEKIYSWMNSKKVHFSYHQDNQPLVCLTSVCLA